MDGVCVVKIGGSLAHDPALRDWLETLAAQGAGRVVIVPGGGPFADAVRSAQARWAFDDVGAHNMAVLAMVQYGLMLKGICPALVTASDATAIRRALRAGRVALWLPYSMMRRRRCALTSWDVSADSLAAHLATRLGSRSLVLVKSCPIAPDRTLSEHVAQGVLDAAFPRYAAGLQVLLVEKGALAAVRNLCAGGRPVAV